MAGSGFKSRLGAPAASNPRLNIELGLVVNWFFLISAPKFRYMP
jgi:hypothetical protein